MENKLEHPDEHGFSIELKSRDFIKSITLSSNDFEGFLIEGFLGQLYSACITEGVILEIAGSKGTLRIDLSEAEFSSLLLKKDSLKNK